MSDMEVDSAIKLFRDGDVSIGRAAKLAGLDRESYMQKLAEVGVPVVNLDPCDLDALRRSLDSVMGLDGSAQCRCYSLPIRLTFAKSA